MRKKTKIKQLDLAPQKKECRECGQEISLPAKKCYHCSSYQNRWRNWLMYLPYSISLVMMAIAITQTLLSYREVELAKKDRSDASEALREIENVKTIVDSVVIEVNISKKNISTLEKDLKEKTENAEIRIAALQEAIDNAALQTANALPARKELKLTYSTHSVQEVSNGIQTIISFDSSVELPLGKVEFLIEVIGKADAKILSINPAEAISFSVMSKIGGDGKKGNLSYVSSGFSFPKIAITLSTPTKIVVQGQPGLDPFELDIK